MSNSIAQYTLYAFQGRYKLLASSFGTLWSSTLATHQADCIPDQMSGRRPDSWAVTTRATHLSSALTTRPHDGRCQPSNRFTHNFTSGTRERTTRVHLWQTSFRPFLFLAHLSPRPPFTLAAFQFQCGSSRHENLIIYKSSADHIYASNFSFSHPTTFDSSHLHLDAQLLDRVTHRMT